ncbi:glycerate kinase type-2 family protein [Anaerotalea alkaliphila]|uniref:Glycerate kinase n=1 Tax=Anaerotalea alkaliphila TaxID=2662126 RepID=A0A7X5HY68_9FIRM|nr:glycerate kinase [Anaerotalea alkaliphila]NDL68798.1 glycerate kinase [Anaerotalea alkaliphila]
MNTVRQDAELIIQASIRDVLPEAAVVKALEQKRLTGRIHVVSIGKAAWTMAKAAKTTLGSQIEKGLVVTKYDHSQGPIEGFEILEAGHPIPDGNSVRGAEKALAMARSLGPEDKMLLLISGGGSALFEKPVEGILLEDLMDITSQLLACGADIVEINTIRKHLSAVKGGKFALECGETPIFAVVLSDVIGDRLDSIASGPAYPDSSTSEEAMEIIRSYGLQVEEHILEALKEETPKRVENCETVVTGSVSALCEAAARNARELGYRPVILSTTVECEAKEMGKMLAGIARELCGGGREEEGYLKAPCAVIAGGETLVRLMGQGKGGRNQELALAAAMGIEGLEEAVVLSLGSDGTDGPTDAAGGMVDGGTTRRMREKGFLPELHLDNNDSYNALKASGDLIVTGPTGTNVNDLMMVLCK